MVQLHLLFYCLLFNLLYDLYYRIVTRKRSKKYVLKSNIDSDNVGENMILLREMSDSGTAHKDKNLDDIFARESVLPPFVFCINIIDT